MSDPRATVTLDGTQGEPCVFETECETPAILSRLDGTMTVVSIDVHRRPTTYCDPPKRNHE